MQSETEKQRSTSPPGALLGLSLEEKMEVDGRSVYVGNVHYGATAEELEQHFYGCGSINRVKILCDKYSGHPKGFAYVEFEDKDSIQTAMALDESLFRGRQIKIMPKRTNRPGISTTDRPPRGRYRGRGRPYTRGVYFGYRPTRRSYRPPRCRT
ncbi:polyadenylate-binding protein 2-like [Centruroides sculpturatus]|uniref:polyadenylate-binding protein 2-like n=1 Tax=Centruroides sculpturatus TaxID=218467 RepID=UPI000C6E03BB|nr:polyadenylate-binding protein 2-like [Centruroides sculpturatus]